MQVPEPKITCHGIDGSVWRYYAIYGPDLAPEETGWVLVVTGVPGLEDAQRLTPAEVVGDVRSMVEDASMAEAITRMETEAMLETLESRRPPDVALVARIAELRRDLGELP